MSAAAPLSTGSGQFRGQIRIEATSYTRSERAAIAMS